MNRRAPFGWTPLLMAIKSGNSESVRILIEAKADVNSKTDKGETPLQKALEFENKEIIFILKEAGAL